MPGFLFVKGLGWVERRLTFVWCSYLNATNEKALQKIKLEDLKAFAVDKQE